MPSGTNIQSIDGTLNNPFFDILDALEKAQELCAPFTSCTTTIYLMKGDHFLLRMVRDYYSPISIARDQ
jgi:hypothetical protein